MKTFIFLFLIVVGFFYYLFISNSQINYENKSLEDIEQIEKHDSEQEIKEYTSLTDEAPTSIPEDQTFDTIKKLLKEASGRSYTSNITLNTRVNSYLYSQERREKFKNGISSAFNLTYDEVDKLYKKNKLVWDWVNEFRE